MTLDEMASDATQWFALRALILSEQVPEDRLAALSQEHPDFIRWFSESVEACGGYQGHDEIADRILPA